MIRIAAHQPNFMPFLGFWHKLYVSDIFILLDDVHITTGSKDAYTHRTQLVDPHGDSQWATLGILNKKDLIKDVKIDPHYDLPKLVDKLTAYYKKSPNEGIWFEHLLLCFKEASETLDFGLSHFNTDFMVKVMAYSGLKELNPIKWIRSSDLDYDRTLKKSERLKAIFDLVADGGKYEYYAGTGSKDYLDESLFNVKYSTWKPLEYAQHNHSRKFVPYASIYDFLVNEGVENLRKFIR